MLVKYSQYCLQGDFLQGKGIVLCPYPELIVSSSIIILSSKNCTVELGV